MFIYGTQMFGKVDHVSGLFYVVTMFFHINYIPLFPSQSYLMIDDGGERGIEIKMHLKSVLVAWLRAACFVGGPIAIFLGVTEMNKAGRGNETTDGMLLTCLGTLAFLFAFASYWIFQAGRRQAVRLAERAGLDPSFVLHHFDQFDKYRGERQSGPITYYGDKR